jgi:hypothetical protein
MSASSRRRAHRNRLRRRRALLSDVLTMTAAVRLSWDTGDRYDLAVAREAVREIVRKVRQAMGVVRG